MTRSASFAQVSASQWHQHNRPMTVHSTSVYGISKVHSTCAYGMESMHRLSFQWTTGYGALWSTACSSHCFPYALDECRFSYGYNDHLLFCTDFCWMCLGDWKTHGSEYYECSRYKENPDIVNQSQQAQAREALKKYLFYFERVSILPYTCLSSVGFF